LFLVCVLLGFLGSLLMVLGVSCVSFWIDGMYRVG
jgi:hypothetical protein